MTLEDRLGRGRAGYLGHHDLGDGTREVWLEFVLPGLDPGKTIRGVAHTECHYRKN